MDLDLLLFYLDLLEHSFILLVSFLHPLFSDSFLQLLSLLICFLHLFYLFTDILQLAQEQFVHHILPLPLDKDTL